MQNIIDSIIYVMYTQENFEYCLGSCFGSYSEYSLYSIFTNALKQARRIQRDDCEEVYYEDDCNYAGPRTGDFQRAEVGRAVSFQLNC
jgi:hypothetical protein